MERQTDRSDQDRTHVRRMLGRHRLGLLLLLPALGLALPAHATTCQNNAVLQHDACLAQTQSAFLTGKANCYNTVDSTARSACLTHNKTVRSDALGDCSAQQTARGALCEALGENRYEPDFNPDHYDSHFANLTHPNPYFPLTPGNRWRYVHDDEVVVVDVTNETKTIRGVTCVIVHDFSRVGGELSEDTDDWIAMRKDGTPVYCGELSRSFQTFANDQPPEPELTSIGGSWKTGRDGGKPGLLFLSNPAVGDTYRQELHLGNAEDSGEVLSTTYKYGDNAELDAHVPRALAKLLCAAGDCVVTRDFSPVEPDDSEHKYYAKGVGLFLTIDLSDGSAEKLVGCNVDPLCDSLP